ncbi:DUF1629 domain-containing protein [Paenibacillus sp. MER 99-2]|uniref:imm11 family protein n=1 Tax=Paenibacillus sp. MER 99-2 TaxID=2939572 RepID=UPI0020406243|nr:DUF1629 domain-containing protein [Paenibacillus sp. MER 99-2]MCM3170793.1 hypothetical protein [Paenibacillus sp. MER 99-2]
MVQQYYELIEDQRILNVFRPPVIDTPYDELPFSSVRRIERKPHDEMTDWITRPAYYMSDRMKRLMENVDETIPFKSVTFINEENGEPFSYWVFKLSNASTFSKKSVFHPDGSLKQLVLDAQAVQDQRIWMLGDVRETRVLVRLDLAESILRRGFTGFVFRKVEME